MGEGCNHLTQSDRFVSGRVPPFHRGPLAARQDLRLHLVQPPGGEAEILQEAREENESGGGEEVQGGVDRGEAGGEAEVGLAAVG